MLSRDEWVAFVQSECLTHPVRGLVHQDPLTWRCFSKPRGYAGDAVMLDYIYAAGDLCARDELVAPLGRSIHRHLAAESPASRAVRFRRDYLARLIDDTAAEAGRPDVVSIAAGHARELERSEAFAERRLGSFLAFDQDAASLEAIGSRFDDRADIRTEVGSVRQILTRKTTFSGKHLVYASGLYDYLSQPTALKLTAALFDMVRPGGRVVVANFLKGIFDVGYMASFMGWDLVLRTPEELFQLGDQFGRRASTEFLLDDDENIGFISIRKR